MRATLVLGTRNPGKIVELRELLAPLPLTIRGLDEYPAALSVEETGDSFSANAALKAAEQAHHLKAWVLGEDSGIVVDAQAGAPGIFSARYAGPSATDEQNNARLLAELGLTPLERRTAHYVCQLALSDPAGKIRAELRSHLSWTSPLPTGRLGGFRLRSALRNRRISPHVRPIMPGREVLAEPSCQGRRRPNPALSRAVERQRLATERRRWIRIISVPADVRPWFGTPPVCCEISACPVNSLSASCAWPRSAYPWRRRPRRPPNGPLRTPANWSNSTASCISSPSCLRRKRKRPPDVAALWKQAGIEVQGGIGGHGIVGILKNGPGPTLMLRTDLDALPVVENTGLAYASQVKVKNKDGATIGVMHACGHDIHMTNLTGVAQFLATHKSAWSGTVMFIGQPAEETGKGARGMLDDGLFTRFAKPDMALALHVDATLETGKIGYRIGYSLANVDSVDITMRGRGGHGAAPHSVDRSDRAGGAIDRFAANHGQPRNEPGRTRGRHGWFDSWRHQAQRHSRLLPSATHGAQLFRRGPAAHFGLAFAARPMPWPLEQAPPNPRSRCSTRPRRRC